MHVAGVIAAGVQPHRPTAVETRGAAIATPQRIVSLADVLAIARDRRRKGLEQRLNDRILTARQILGGLSTLAQGLIEGSMAVRIVQAHSSATSAPPGSC